MHRFVGSRGYTEQLHYEDIIHEINDFLSAMPVDQKLQLDYVYSANHAKHAIACLYEDFTGEIEQEYVLYLDEQGE